MAQAVAMPMAVPQQAAVIRSSARRLEFLTVFLMPRETVVSCQCVVLVGIRFLGLSLNESLG